MIGAAALGTLLVAGAAFAVAATRTKAEEALTSLTASLTSQPAAAQAARTQVAKAQDALERGAKARRAGDAAHADLLDELGLEWAVTAVDVARTAALEERAAQTEAETAELEARTKRALTLIEQTMARRGKAMQQLQALGVELAPGELETAPAASAAEAAPGKSTGKDSGKSEVQK